MEKFIVVGSDYWYVWQPVWLCYFVLTFIALIVSTKALHKYGPRHPVLSLLPAEIAGGYTVCAAVTVSTFIFDYVLKKQPHPRHTTPLLAPPTKAPPAHPTPTPPPNPFLLGGTGLYLQSLSSGYASSY